MGRFMRCLLRRVVDGIREPVTGKGRLGPAGKGEKNFADDWYYLAEGEVERR